MESLYLIKMNSTLSVRMRKLKFAEGLN